MRFQSFPMLNGITGWMLMTFWVRSAEPMPKLKFSCNGTLMRLAIGFCDCFLKSSAFVAAAGVASVPTKVPAGLTGASCALSSKVKGNNTSSTPNAKTTRLDKFITGLFPFLRFAFHACAARLPHPFNLGRAPSLGEERFEWAVQPEHAIFQPRQIEPSLGGLLRLRAGHRKETHRQ